MSPRQLLTGAGWPGLAGLGEVNAQLPTSQSLLAEILMGFDGTFDISEVGVGEASWPARVTVYSHANVLDIFKFAEHLVEIRI
jgi:hypothetical protein